MSVTTPERARPEQSPVEPGFADARSPGRPGADPGRTRHRTPLPHPDPHPPRRHRRARPERPAPRPARARPSRSASRSCSACRRAAPKRPTGLVLVPTRELAKQVVRRARVARPRSQAPRRRRVRRRRLRPAAAGTAPRRRRARRLPGRLGDLLERREVVLDAVETVVVDEADRMADMGFLPAVRALLDLTPSSRQTLLYSATLDGVVDTLVRNYQRDPVRHVLPDDPAAPSLARHLWWAVERDERAPDLRRRHQARRPHDRVLQDEARLGQRRPRSSPGWACARR